MICHASIRRVGIRSVHDILGPVSEMNRMLLSIPA
jgi:hypothetical protein